MKTYRLKITPKPTPGGPLEQLLEFERLREEALGLAAAVADADGDQIENAETARRLIERWGER